MIVFYRLDGRTYNEIGRVENGEIVSGEDELDGIVYGPNLSDEDELLDAHDGPHVIAQMENESDDGDSPPGSPDTDTEKQLEKKWIPYRGPDGGEGWQNSHDADDVRYQTDPPGEIADGWEDTAEGWGDFEDEDIGMKEFIEIAEDVLDTSVENSGATTPLDLLSTLESTVNDERFSTTESDMEEIRERANLPAEGDRGEFGWRERRETVELDNPEPKMDTSAMDLSEFGEPEDGSVWESGAKSGSVHWEVRDRLEENWGEIGNDAITSLYDWKNSGYYRVDEIWAAAMAVNDIDKVPNHYEEKNYNFDPSEGYKALTDVIELSKAQAKEEFGETVTVYRGFTEDTLDNYAQHNDDGSITIKPQALESWSVKEEVAQNHAERQSGLTDHAVAELEVSTDDVAYYGPFAMGDMGGKTFGELTLSREEPYTVPADQLTDHDPDKYQMDKQELRELPPEASDWISQMKEGVEKIDSIQKEWIPYQGPHGGEGWQEVESGEVRYVEEPPGQTRTGNAAPPGDGMTPEERAWLEEHGDEEALAEVREEAPDGTTETSEEITWDNVNAGDEIAYYDERGQLQEGEVTAVEQNAFGVVWVKDGNSKTPVEQEDFIGTPEEKIIDGVEAPDEMTDEWMDENLFYGQKVKLYNKHTDTIEYAEVEQLLISGGEITGVELEIENRDGGFGGLVTITNGEITWGRDNDNDKYEIQETSSWESMDEEEQRNALKRQYRENTDIRSISQHTRELVNEQVTENIVNSFKDQNVARETMKSLFKIENKVSRASCSGSGSVSIKVSKRAPIDTTRHEFGHAVVSSFEFDYRRGPNIHRSNVSHEKYKRRPTNLSEDYDELKTRYDTIAFDFSEDSDFFAPEDYMLRDKNANNEIIEFSYDEIESGKSIFIDTISPLMQSKPYKITSVGDMVEGKLSIDISGAPDVYIDSEGTIYEYDSFGGGFQNVGQTTGFVEDNLPPGYSEWKDTVEEEVHGDTELEQREYESAEDMSPKEVFESVGKGDVVRFQHEDKTFHLIAQEKEDLAQEDRRDYEFVHPGDGSQWNFTTSGGELQFSDHIVTGYDDTYSDEEEASPSVDDPLENFEGLQANAETTEERMDNLVSAVNRAWYKQAKEFENDPEDFGHSAVSIGSGYSATNAHETMAKTHEVMLHGDSLAVSQLVEEHPYLVAAYVEVFEPHQYSKDSIRRSDAAEKYGIEV